MVLGDVNPRGLVQKCACMFREIMLMYRLNEPALVVCLFCLLKLGEGGMIFIIKEMGSISD